MDNSPSPSLSRRTHINITQSENAYTNYSLVLRDQLQKTIMLAYKHLDDGHVIVESGLVNRGPAVVVYHQDIGVVGAETSHRVQSTASGSEVKGCGTCRCSI